MIGDLSRIEEQDIKCKILDSKIQSIMLLFVLVNKLYLGYIRALYYLLKLY